MIWQAPDGACLRGKWRAEGEELCFAYEDRPGLWQCWEVRDGPRGLHARIAGAPPGADLRVSAETLRPLVCDGTDRPV